MALSPRTQGPRRAPEISPRTLEARGSEIPRLLQQQQKQRLQLLSPGYQRPESAQQVQQMPQQQQSQQHQKVRTVAWQTSADEDDGGSYEAEARIDVTAQCRAKEGERAVGAFTPIVMSTCTLSIIAYISLYSG